MGVCCLPKLIAPSRVQEALQVDELFEYVEEEEEEVSKEALRDTLGFLWEALMEFESGGLAKKKKRGLQTARIPARKGGFGSMKRSFRILCRDCLQYFL